DRRGRSGAGALDRALPALRLAGPGRLLGQGALGDALRVRGSPGEAGRRALGPGAANGEAADRDPRRRLRRRLHRARAREGAGEPDVEVVLVARENFVLFTPMLHEVAGGDLAVADIVQPLRKMLRRTRIEIGEVTAIDLVKKQVRITHAGMPHPYDLDYDQLV